MDKLIKKVEFFLKKHDLLHSKSTFIVAFSGGWDSMCLLDVMSKLSYEYKFNLVAAHLNHNWRGLESKKEEEACKKFAHSKNIDFFSETLDSDVNQNETCARELRYEFFATCAKKFNSECVLTAHNFDDNAETILYRITKGTGTRGLEGIKEKRGIYYRPLIEVSREEIEEYCKANNLTPNNDSSNSDTKYKRNFIRHKVLPLLKEINPNVVNAINSLSDLAIDDNEIINEYLCAIKKDLYKGDKIKTDNFNKLSDAIKSRLIYEIFIENNIDYDRGKINIVLDFIKENKDAKSGKTCSLTTDLWVFVSQKFIEIVEKHEKKNIDLIVNKPGEYETDDFIFEIAEYANEINDFPKDNGNIAYIDLSSIDFGLNFRTRRDGDIICPLGLLGTQKLKKYLISKQIPKHEKDCLMFLCKGNEILWASSLGISEKVKVVNKPTHVVKLTYK